MSVVETTNPMTLQQVARLGRLDSGLLDRLRHEALTVPSEWVAEYGQYQSGGGGRCQCSTIAVSPQT